MDEFDLNEHKNKTALTKLLNYTKKDKLINFITQEKYTQLEQQIMNKTGKSKVNMKEMKKYLASNNDFEKQFRKSALAEMAYQKYNAAADRMRNIDRTRAAKVKRFMAQPRRRFLGCIATKVQPKDYEDCLDNFDNDKYDNIGMVPSALKQRVYDNTSNQLVKAALEPTVVSKWYSANDIPSGLKAYIGKHPSEFKNYFSERRHELGLMKAVLRNMTPGQKQSLREYYQEQKDMNASDLQKLLTPTKKGRTKRKKVT